MNNIPSLFVDSPLFVRVIVSIIVLLPTILSSSSIVLHFKKDKRHSSCKMYPSLTQRDEMKDKIREIRKDTILYEQMNTVSSSNVSILFEMNNIYSRLTNNRLDIKHYEKLVELIERKKIKPKLRKFMKENHFTSRTEQEFSLYVDEKIEFLINVVTKHLNDDYENALFETPREVLQQENYKFLVPFVKDKWRKMFYDCRDISRTWEAEIKRLEDKLEIWE